MVFPRKTESSEIVPVRNLVELENLVCLMKTHWFKMFHLKIKLIETTYYIKMKLNFDILLRCHVSFDKKVIIKLILSNYYVAIKNIISNTYAEKNSGYT